MKIIFLIPSFNPDNLILNYINELIDKFHSEVIVVDDGSTDKLYLNDLKKLDQVTLLMHTTNKGKGCALKTGFNFIITEKKDTDFIITVDADGQHQIFDIENLVSNLKHNSKKTIYLGCRNFNSNTPIRSKFGNIVTSKIVKAFTGKNINDTQTGLRAIPINLLPNLILLKGDRFEFEMQVLLWCIENNIYLKNIPIQAHYIDQNKSSNFRPIIDSIKIYNILFSSFLNKKLQKSVKTI